MTIDRRTTHLGNTATLSSKFQISIPKQVREEQDWKPGQEFAFIPKGKSVVLVPVPKLEDLLGIAPGADRENYRDRDDRH
jgi:AbrB family looped-hinge helix DNA binding protein